MNSALELIECPRDAMQGWKHPISTPDKVRYINALLKVGFHTIDFGSFVSPRLMPQMADTHEVVKQLDTNGSATRLLAIVANNRGANDAVVYDQISYLGFPFSVSPTFQQKNTNSSPEESLIRVAEMQELCLKYGKELIVYMSMGFGNPYGDSYDFSILSNWIKQITKLGISTISIADTVGMASPGLVEDVISSSIHEFPEVNIGVHLHSTPQGIIEKIEAAFNAGCTRFDGAIGGIGGCPMADDELVGNMDSLIMIQYFRDKGLDAGIDSDALEHAVRISREIFL